MQFPHPEHALIDVDADVRVGQGSRLGNPVRARGVQDDGAVVQAGQRMGGVDGPRRGRGAVPRHAGRGHGAAQLSAHLARARHRQLQEETLGGGHRERNIDRQDRVERIEGIGVDALFPHDRDPTAVTRQLPGYFLRGSEGIVLGRDRPDAHAGVEGHESLRAVR